jgi:hypothetical protein
MSVHNDTDAWLGVYVLGLVAVCTYVFGLVAHAVIG